MSKIFNYHSEFEKMLLIFLKIKRDHLIVKLNITVIYLILKNLINYINHSFYVFFSFLSFFII